MIKNKAQLFKALLAYQVLVSTISNSQVYLLKKCEFFFSKNISIYAIFNDQSFNNSLTNDIISFEQLGPGGKEHLLYLS